MTLNMISNPSTKYLTSAGLCSELSSLVNGQVTLTGLTCGSTASYTCYSGYTLLGEQNRTCLCTGMWSGQEPTCESMYSLVALGYKRNEFVLCVLRYMSNLLNSTGLCSELSSPTNGQVTWTGLTSGSTATYTCDSGYHLIGDQNRTCLSSGVWSGQEPTCESMHLLYTQ